MLISSKFSFFHGVSFLCFHRPWCGPSLFSIFKFYGPALLSSTEDASAKACVFVLPVGLCRVWVGTPPGFSFLCLFFPLFVRALILSPLARVMGNVYVFSRIKATSSGAFWLCFQDGIVELTPHVGRAISVISERSFQLVCTTKSQPTFAKLLQK